MVVVVGGWGPGVLCPLSCRSLTELIYPVVFSPSTGWTCSIIVAMGCISPLFVFLSVFFKTAMRVALVPLFLLISSEVINVVYSAEPACIPPCFSVNNFCVMFCVCILNTLSLRVHELVCPPLPSTCFLITYILNPNSSHRYPTTCSNHISYLHPLLVSEPSNLHSITITASCRMSLLVKK